MVNFVTFNDTRVVYARLSTHMTYNYESISISTNVLLEELSRDDGKLGMVRGAYSTKTRYIILETENVKIGIRDDQVFQLQLYHGLPAVREYQPVLSSVPHTCSYVYIL